ncbi:hypothetical protein WRPBWLFC_CDS0017 [Escherichia phage SM_S22]
MKWRSRTPHSEAGQAGRPVLSHLCKTAYLITFIA